MYVFDISASHSYIFTLCLCQNDFTINYLPFLIVIRLMSVRYVWDVPITIYLPYVFTYHIFRDKDGQRLICITDISTYRIVVRRHV